LEIDRSLASAHALMGVATLLVDHDWKTAEDALLRAIQLNPADTSAHGWLGALFYAASGRFEAAMAQTREWIALDPLNPAAVTGLGWELYLARRFDEAVAELDRVITMAPGYAPALCTRGHAHTQAGAFDRAIRDHRLAADSSGGLPFFRAGLAHALAAAGLA